MKYYNDPTFSYPAFWSGREYEHQAELLAIRKLLKTSKFERIVDIGAGFGRLANLLQTYSDEVILIDPSYMQLNLVKDFVNAPIEAREGDSEHTGLENESCDLVTMVRVAHHLLHPKGTFREVARILKPKGFFLLEFANSTNFKARMRNGLKEVALTSVDMGSEDIKVPFVNHHPNSIKRALREEGFVIKNVLSVSNFRSTFLKKIAGTRTLLTCENNLQKPLGSIHFGPSIFILAQKI